MGINMKQFDLEKALAGEAVELRNGSKAILYYRVPDHYTLNDGVKITFPLVGIIFYEDGTVEDPNACWKDNGRFTSSTSGKDIVGMWEEPKLTTAEIMEKAFKERLSVRHNQLPSYHKGFKVVGKTVDNTHILQSCDDHKMYFFDAFIKDVQWSINTLRHTEKSMTKYRKKPVVIDAWQLTKENVEVGIPAWIDLDTVHIVDGDVLFAEIVTLEGVMQASEGDYIIKGVQGEFYACKPDIFEQTYEVAENETHNG